MNRLLRDLSNEDVSGIIDDGLFDYCCRVAKSGKKPLGLENSISWVKTFPTFWSNFIFRSDFKDDKIDATIQKHPAP